jgi:hypothetical protein
LEKPNTKRIATRPKAAAYYFTARDTGLKMVMSITFALSDIF